MNAARTPGFTAEASLSKTRGYYLSLATESYSLGEGRTVIPSVAPRRGTIATVGGVLCFVACYGACRVLGGNPHDCTIGCSNVCGFGTIVASSGSVLV